MAEEEPKGGSRIPVMNVEHVSSILDIGGDYIERNIGELAGPGMPRREPRSNQWLIPIMCQCEFGSLIVGEIRIDDSGAVRSAATADEVIRRLSQMCRKLKAPDPADDQLAVSPRSKSFIRRKSSSVKA